MWTALLVSGLLTIVFAGGLYRTVADRWSGKVGARLIELAGLPLTLSGLATMNPVSPAVIGVQSAMGLPLLVAIPPALFLIGHALSGNRP